MTIIQTQIQAKIQSFAQELEHLVRQAAMVAVGEALGTGAPKAAVRRKGAKKAAIAKSPAKKASKKKAMPKPAKKAAIKKPATKPAKKVRGSARSPEMIGAAAEKILRQIKANPGQRSEDVRKAVGTAKNVWILAIAKLVDEKKIVKKGEKRATSFTAK